MKRSVLLGMLALLLAAGCSDSGSNASDTSGGDIFLKPGDVTKEDTTSKETTALPGEDVKESNLPPGYMEFCLGDADCAQHGLTCFATNPTDAEAFCSNTCAGNDDCPPSMLCKPWNEQQVCQPSAFCDTCQSDAQCGPDGRCVEDSAGGRFCSAPCAKDDPEACGAGNFCNKVGTGLEDYYCYPMFGQCKGDGTHCTPCQSDDDCLKNLVCHENPYTFERYCAKICQTKMDCPKGFACEELQGEQYPLCTLEVEGEVVETCYKGNKSFCEPCMKDYECSSGVCYNYPVANKYFCSFLCDEDTWPDTGCPPGLFCVPNHGETQGDICAPPTGFGCQGFLNCIAVECPKGEKCVGGFCEPK